MDALSGQVESHLIISNASRTTVALETDFDIIKNSKTKLHMSTKQQTLRHPFQAALSLRMEW